MRTDLNSLKIFAQIVEANSFSEAARRLKMPLSTVSRRIAEFEGQLGIRLLERSTRNLRLTDAGSEVLEHARQAVELSDAIDNVISNHLSNVSGTLRLSAPPSISDSLIAPLVGAFQASYPEVRVQVFITDRIVDQISEGVDVAFRVGPLKDSTLVARRLPIVQPELLREGLLVEVMSAWHLGRYDLSLVHLGSRFIPRPVRAFKEFAAQMTPKLFPKLPT
jgi:DNA-binding transcriptional LysR family regulator